jgi:hypothetical protein
MPKVGGDTCQSCGRADELNGRYCVLCGATITRPTVELDAVGGSLQTVNVLLGSHAGGGTFSNAVGGLSSNASGEPNGSSGSNGSGGKGPAGSADSSKPMNRSVSFLQPLAVIVCAIVGTGLGAAGGWIYDRRAPSLPLPAKGLVVLTAKPYAEIFLAGGDNKHFVVGHTGQDGNFEYQPDDDTYPLKGCKLDFDNKAQPKSVNLDPGHVMVVDLRKNGS